MPKLITNTGIVTNNKSVYKPTFFGKNLTGSGSKTGLLREAANPIYYPAGYPSQISECVNAHKSVNGNTTIYNIPLYIIPPMAWRNIITEFDRPDMYNLTHIAHGTNNELYMAVPVHALQIDEISGDTTLRYVSANFSVFLFAVADPGKITHEIVGSTKDLHSAKTNVMYRTVINNMCTDLGKHLPETLRQVGYTVDDVAISDFITNYSLYAAVCRASERWQTQADKYICDVLAKNTAKMINSGSNNDGVWFSNYGVFTALSNMEAYNDVPLDTFQRMYKSLNNYISDPSVLNELCKSNLNMMLSNTLYHMDQNRANLKFCPDTDKSVLTQTVGGNTYSLEQQKAIASVSPLTLVQSGAGTGKSTIILARIQHMIKNGIDPKKILVLSFTNNAADNISEKCPNVNSMTIDKMMRLIYMHNYSHSLSSIPTIINSIDIFYANAPASVKSFLNAFTNILNRLKNNKAYTQATNFIEKNMDAVLQVLDTINQTSLELQSIICYLNMDKLKEPPEVSAEHLIIDEVQDNSIAQFIYAIKYTDKHMSSLYMVGDCSQTLYEFRSSNPRALNVLEGSGVFATFKLQINYRSNQSILDFANISLANIEANRYANIRLYANSMAPVTLKAFKEAVQVHYESMPNMSETSKDAMFAKSISKTMPYMQDKFLKGEQITVLAYDRKTLAKAEEYIRKAFPTVPMLDKKNNCVLRDQNGVIVTAPIQTASLTSKRIFDSTIFSSFIKSFWSKIKYAPPTDIISTINREMLAQAKYLAFKASNITKVTNMINGMTSEFRATYGGRIKRLEAQVQSSVITSDKMLDDIKRCMLSFEIEKNSLHQAVMAAKNNEAKQNQSVANANVVFSTIHAAKGLEFDNVLLYYNGCSDDKLDEEEKRMYYVALTRAKKTEFIWAYDSRIVRSKLAMDYQGIIDALTKKERAAAMQALKQINNPAKKTKLSTHKFSTVHKTFRIKTGQIKKCC